MESTALEEKINKIRLRNEEIKRRHEEVEADKKNAAKLDALIDPVPTEDWPERKEPPEFSASAPKQANKSKHSIRKHGDQGPQYYAGSGDGKKAHGFADGQGPPPDPKYNFLADSEREEYGEQIPKDSERNRGRNKLSRGGFRRRGSGRDWHTKEQWGPHANPGDMTLPEYEAWRAERNRIDEARISRQRTAEGNWRREWDNDKVHLVDDVSKRDNRVTLGDVVSRQEHGENEKHYRSPRMAPRSLNYGGHREPYHATAVPEASKNYGSAGDTEKRVVIATDKSIKVSVNHGTTPPKPSVMSVKVSSTTIAGTGRVGPRQRPRMMYSSLSEVEVPNQERPTFTRHKSADEKINARQTDQTHKAVSPKSPGPQRRRDGDAKSPYLQRRDNERADGTGKPFKKDSQKSPYPQRRGNSSSNYPPKSPRVHRRSTDSFKQRHNSENSNTTSVRGASDVEGADGPPKSLDSSSAIDNVKSNESLNNDDKTDSVPLKLSLLETSVTPAVESASESANNCKENNSAEQSAPQESASPEMESALETERVAQCAEVTKDERSDNLYGEASGTQEAKSTVDSAATKHNDVESTESEAINCSADSGLASNDSGFIEQPSNDSIHNVSESETLESSGIADTSSESVGSGSQLAEDRSVIESRAAEVKVPDAPIRGTAEASSSNSEIRSEPETVLAGTSEEEKSNDSTITSNIAESAVSISQATNAETPASVPGGVDNNSHDTANETANTESIKVGSKPDATTDVDNSSSAQLESPAGGAEMPMNLHDKLAETPANVPEGADKKFNDVANEIANIELIKVESKEMDTSSVCGDVDATRDAGSSSSAQLETNTEGAQMPTSPHDESGGDPQDATNDNGKKSSAPSRPQDKVAATTEKLIETIENTQETKITSNDESKIANGIVKENTLLAQASSSPAIEKH